MSPKKKISLFDRFCPSCGEKLIEQHRPGGGMCGSINRYDCPSCKKVWEEDQSGIVGRPINLTDITDHPRMPKW